MLSAAKEKRQHGSMQVPYSYYAAGCPTIFPAYRCTGTGRWS